jgi:membrane protein YqaA with SNARE-associated domain
LKNLYSWTLTFAEHKYNTYFLSLFSFIEAIFFPIPVDPILMIMGTANSKKTPFYSFIASLSSVLGGVCGYFLGYFLWDSLGPLFLKYIISPTLFAKMSEGFTNHAFLSIFLAGFTPLPFKVFTLAAGFSQLPLLPFLTASLLSRSLRFMAIGVVFYFYGPKIKSFIEKYFEKISIIVGIILVVGLIIFKFLF